MTLPEEQCTRIEMHAGHKYSNDRGLNYQWCPGMDMATATRLTDHTAHFPGHCGVEKKHGSHLWRGSQVFECSGSLLTTPSVKDDTPDERQCDIKEVHGPHQWSYHIEKHEDGSYLVVKKRGDGFDPNWESKVGKYSSPYYARLVADVLNGGVLLGYEMEK